MKKKNRNQLKKRYLNKIFGTLEKPRLSVFRSNNHIYGQLIDDKYGKTLVSSSTLEKDLTLKTTSNKEAAYIVGKSLGQKAQQKNITKIIFDRGEKRYHGRIQSLAEGARETGLIF